MVTIPPITPERCPFKGHPVPMMMEGVDGSMDLSIFYQFLFVVVT